MPDEPSSPHATPKTAGPISQKIAVGVEATSGVCASLKKRATGWGEALWARFEKLVEARGWLVLIALTLVWLLPGNNLLPLVDRDEPRFAFATEEMLARQAGGDAGAWVVPTFNNVGRYDKPPLVYWWMCLHYTFGGYNDFSARLHSVVAMLGCVLLVWAFARRLYTPAIGFWSSFAFLTSFQVFEHGRLCVADAAMLLFTLSGIWAVWEILQKPEERYGIFKTRWVAPLVLWLSLALGFATKWVVPPVVVAAAVLGFAALERKWFSLKEFYPVSGLGLFLLLTLAWAVPAWIYTGGDFFTIGIGEHVFHRGVNPMNARHYNPIFYLGTIWLSLMPWVAGVGAIFGFLKSNWGRREKFLVGWFASTLLLFSLSQTELPHYILPGLPALLILIAGATSLQKPTGFWAGWIYKTYYALFGAVLRLELILALTVPANGPAVYAKVAGISAALTMGGFLALGWGITHRKGLLSAVSFVGVPLAFVLAGWALRQANPALEVAEIFDRNEPPALLIASGFEEPSLTAYTGRIWNYQPDTAAALKAFESAPSAVLLLQTREIKLEEVGRVWLKLPVRTARIQKDALLPSSSSKEASYRVEGVNLGHFSWVEGILYLKP
jgi:4-amino-4-deoxy-L-arabinose transferase-like glycosyltransferase